MMYVGSCFSSAYSGQVRSVGGEIADRKLDLTFDFWAIDYREEFSVANGRVIEDQVAYLHCAIRRILSLYAPGSRSVGKAGIAQSSSSSSSSSSPQSVVILAHSMGGILVRSLMSSSRFTHPYHASSIRTVIMLATPNLASPLPLDSRLNMIYDDTNSYWQNYSHYNGEGSLKDVVVLSLGGGSRDKLVASESVPMIVSPTTKSISSHYLPLLGSKEEVSEVGQDMNVNGDWNRDQSDGRMHLVNSISTSSPHMWLQADHQAIVWCNQVVKVISDSIVGAVQQEERDSAHHGQRQGGQHHHDVLTVQDRSTFFRRQYHSNIHRLLELEPRGHESDSNHLSPSTEQIYRGCEEEGRGYLTCEMEEDDVDDQGVEGLEGVEGVKRVIYCRCNVREMSTATEKGKTQKIALKSVLVRVNGQSERSMEEQGNRAEEGPKEIRGGGAEGMHILLDWRDSVRVLAFRSRNCSERGDVGVGGGDEGSGINEEREKESDMVVRIIQVLEHGKRREKKMLMEDNSCLVDWASKVSHRGIYT